MSSCLKKTEKLENDEEEVMENMLGQSMHGDHDGKVSFSIRGLDGPRNSHAMVIQKARAHTFASLLPEDIRLKLQVALAR